jgi:hypothetical protein
MITYENEVCYKCEANEVSVPVGTVHPLCDECSSEHDDWFTRQLANVS